MAPPSEEKQNIFQKNERKTVNELDWRGPQTQLCSDKKAKNEWLINDSTLFY